MDSYCAYLYWCSLPSLSEIPDWYTSNILFTIAGTILIVLISSFRGVNSGPPLPRRPDHQHISLLSCAAYDTLHPDFSDPRYPHSRSLSRV